MWKLEGYDTFSNETYDIGTFLTKEGAEAAGRKRLKELSKSQPGNLQDRVFVVCPEGSKYRLL